MNAINLLEKLNHQQAEEILNRAKALVFALWQGTGIATTKQIAQYYDITEKKIRSIVENHKQEFELDGSKVLMGKDLKSVMPKLGITTALRSLRVKHWK